MLAIGLFALVMAELATAIAAALASNVSWADAVGSFTVTNGAMGLGFAACGCCWPGTARAIRSGGCSWPPGSLTRRRHPQSSY